MPTESKKMNTYSKTTFTSNNHPSLLLRFSFNLLFFLFFPTIVFTQSSQEKIATAIKEQVSNYQLKPSDISDWIITDEHVSKTSGIHHIYVRQRYQGIEIFKTNAAFHFKKEGQLLKQSNQFIANIEDKVQPNFNPISAKVAIEAIAKVMDYPLTTVELLTNNLIKNEQIWSNGGISRRDIPSKQVYVLNEQNQLILSWDISIYEKDNPNWWSFKVDAGTGKILQQDNWVISCTWEPSIHTNKKGVLASPLSVDSKCSEHHQRGVASSLMLPKTFNLQKNNLIDNASYTVYPLGIISPDVSGRKMITNPAKPNTSPFGWHDTDGIAGAEYTITRGNNVWAKEDRANDDETTIGFSPDGGNDLNFNYPLDFDSPPIDNQEAALTNLFYWCNVVHDVAYQYGFDEVSGNFQANNYGKGGLGNDELLADGFDGSGFNNANISVSPDGSRPVMQMYLWNTVDFKVNSPSIISGAYANRAASFGNSSYNLSGNLVLVEDIAGNATEGCSGNYSNAMAINGNIALIDRGSCEFGTKSLYAQNAGAIAVIICNNEPGNVTAAAGTDGEQVIIPVLTIKQEACTILKANLAEGVHVNLSTGLKDSNFDNGIITHEYAHGISIRLLGGASNNICLLNIEQMGEGWSDWYALMLTMQAGDTRHKSRGIGTYVTNDPIDGVGIRPFPYSTDITVNPHTYADIPNLEAPHEVGAVWCAMLWDMTWNLIDNYGFDPDIYNGLGGNNIALNLVTEGLKLTSCFPGFVDAREGLLAADTALYNGKYSYEIWTAFAKRGLGVSADQGGNSNIEDGQAAFDLPTPFQDIDGDGIPNFQDTCKGNDLIDINQNGLPDLCEPCEANEADLLLANQVFSQGFYEATNSILTEGDISIDNLDTVILKTNKSITLTPGFSVSSPAHFIATIDKCSANTILDTRMLSSTKSVGIENKSIANLTKKPLKPTLSVYPNPTNGFTTFSYNLPVSQKAGLDILNAQGQVVTALKATSFLASGVHQFSYDLGKFEMGVYFVVLRGETTILVEKLLIN